MTDWKQDAVEFGQHVRAGEWRLGLLVARNVLPNKGGRPKTTQKTDTAVTVSGKVSGREFAKTAGVSYETVRRYLEAWQHAAKAEIVPDATLLVPGEELEGLDVETLPSWSTYYRKVRKDNRVSDREVVDAIKAKPELVRDAITSDQDEVAQIASDAIVELKQKRIADKAKAHGVPQGEISNKDWRERFSDIDEQFEGALEELGRVDLIKEYLACATAVSEYASAIEKYGVIGVVKEQTQIEEANSLLSEAVWTTAAVLKKNVEKKTK